ncbi:MAG: class I SAM-dependent methyltransferase [Acetivibrionales bacterium]|jgi:23S rRNA (cytosine1962-C5)-methyltransferase|nr:SAM-dependent methyltransferase [Clostridiaceae bacterium]
MIIADQWTDYKLLDAGDKEKVESWKGIILRRPDPQAIWPWTKMGICDDVHAHYHRSNAGGGSWEYKKKIPASWNISYKNLTFHVEPTGFKHTGLFPEQAANWDWMSEKIKMARRPVSVLNLFAYTGGATCACLEAGASVCHVDASKGMVAWAKKNVTLSNLADKPVRFIVDDCMKFVQREIRRGRVYDAIIMDPPSYGRGPKGELWKLEDELYPLVMALKEVMSDSPLFFLLNSYTTGFSPRVSANMLDLSLGRKYGGRIISDEIGLPVENSSIILPCGNSARWEI